MSTLTNSKIRFTQHQGKISVNYDGRLVFSHTPREPGLYVGKGKETVEMYRGNFDMSDYVSERIGLNVKEVIERDNILKIDWNVHPSDETIVLSTEIMEREGRLYINLHQYDESYNRSWIRIPAKEEEKIYGGGEQLSYLNLRGRNFPLWTSEPGVGRNKETYTTFQADVKDKAGGDYYTTNYPQPTYMSTEKYFCHVDTTSYADFDFRDANFHELHFWEVPRSIIISTAENYKELQQKIANLFGKQPELPDWTYNGVWLGIQGGTDVVEEKLHKAEEVGLKVAAVWCQDWQGRRITSFGKRLQWNWQWDAEQYPGLEDKIKEWENKNIRFLGYVNPYLVNDGALFQEAQELQLLAKNEQGEDYLVDFGEFYCGVVDFTNPKAKKWYKEVIKKYAIDFGMSGWMADFGEYLPTDVVLYDGSSAMKKHNEWPVLWGNVNKEAISEAGKWGEIVYFMRAGYTGIQSNCTLLWAGDQSVNWSMDDGLASVIPAALSAGISGMGLHHSDIGGYTSLHGNKRSKELLMRWVELAAFTPVMRTHEGNRPDDCFQFDDDMESLVHLKRMTDVYCSLSPYLKVLVKENAKKGIPVQRPLFYEFEDDENSYDIQYQYMLGPDLLVAPVYQEGKNTWEVYLPEDQWVHLWSGNTFKGGHVKVDAPIGEPPVFYRKRSDYADLFEEISKN